MPLQDFEDRFTYGNPALAAVTVSDLDETALANLSPDLVVYGNLVRQHSILTQNRTLQEVYTTATQVADPRIALVLAAAKDNNGVTLFPNIELVKAIMFGPATNTSNEFENEPLNIFVDGIRRVSVAFTAAFFIGQLAQIPEQFKHAEYLERIAYEDLDRIIQVADAQALAAAVTATSGDGENKAFFFENKTYKTASPIVCEVYLPTVGNALGAGANWVTVNTYTNDICTADVVADIADTVNELTLVSGTTNLIAAPVLAGNGGYHCLGIQARASALQTVYELIIVRFRYEPGSTLEFKKTPFRWGLTSTDLNFYPINSNLISVKEGKVSSSLSAVTAEEPIYLYFKRAPVNTTFDVLDFDDVVIPEATWSTGQLSFRISPTQTEPVTVPVPREVLISPPATPEEQYRVDSFRYADVALILLNEMFKVKGTSRALGALVRNDDPDEIEPMAALELVAFSVTNPESWIILDILEVPADILVATGGINGPTTRFSNKPRSVRIESKCDLNYDPLAAAGSAVNVNATGKVVIGGCDSPDVNYIHDQAHKITGRNWV